MVSSYLSFFFGLLRAPAVYCLRAACLACLAFITSWRKANSCWPSNQIRCWVRCPARVSGFSIVESSQVFVLLLLLVLPLIALAWAPPKTYQADLLHHRCQLHQQLRQQSAQRPWLPRVAPEPGSRTLGSPKGSGRFTRSLWRERVPSHGLTCHMENCRPRYPQTRFPETRIPKRVGALVVTI